MKSRKTTNFEFLEEISPELYGLAVKMEEDLLITPVSMLTYATRFLEYILHDIADECNYDVNTKDGFVDKVNQLIRSDYLSNSLHNNLPQLLIDAYNERSYSIHSHKIEESLKNDEIIAFRLNETIFYIADAYYKKKTGNDEKHIYVKPQKVKKDFKPNSVKKSKTEPVKTIKKEKENLKKDIPVKSKPINEPPKTEKPEKNIQFHNPKSHDESAIGEFVKLLENGYSQQNALKHVDINQAIINNWYMHKKSEFLEGYKDDLFVKYNELLIENAINSISENNGVGSNSGKLEFWIENFEEYIDDLSQDLTGEQLKVFQIVFKRNSPKKVKFDIEEHSQKNIPVESSIDEKELERRKQLMLDNIEKCNFNLALKKSRLDPYEIQKSKKEFLKTKIKNYYGDEVEFSLILKPIESLSVVIPTLYEQYCIDNDLPMKDIRSFLANVEKKLIVFISHYDEKRNHNKSKQRVQTMDVGVENNYRRLEKGNIIDYHMIYLSFKFSYFLSYEKLI